MTHQRNKKHLPPERSAEEYEKKIQRMRMAMHYVARQLRRHVRANQALPVEYLNDLYEILRSNAE